MDLLSEEKRTLFTFLAVSHLLVEQHNCVSVFKKRCLSTVTKVENTSSGMSGHFAPL